MRLTGLADPGQTADRMISRIDDSLLLLLLFLIGQIILAAAFA